MTVTTTTTVTREFDAEGRCVKETTETVVVEDKPVTPFFTPNPVPYTPPPPYRQPYPQPNWSGDGWTYMGWAKDKPEDEDPPPGLASDK